MRILISGYYGFNNAGDEAILAATLGGLRARMPECEITVLSADPVATRAAHGVQVQDRWSKSAVWRAIGWADLVLQGGGGLIQDTTSTRSSAYYLGILEAATWRRTPYAFYAQGIGPIAGGAVRWATARAARKAAAITVRDSRSAALLAELGVAPDLVTVTADPAALVEPSPAEDVAHLLPPPGERPRIGFALRLVPGCESLIDGARQAARELGGSAAIVPLALHSPDDVAISETLAADFGARVVGGAETLSSSEWVGVVRSLDFIVAMRLHSAIFAAAQGVGFVSLAYDPKVAAFADSVGAPHIGKGASAESSRSRAANLTGLRKQA